MATKRILDETTASAVASDDYLYIDGATNGSRKITPDNIVAGSSVATQLANHISDAEETVEEIHSDLLDVKSDLGDLSNLETEDTSSIVNAINEVASSGGSGDGLTAEIKSALLQIARKVAYIDDDGQDYYDELYDALYPSVVSITCSYTPRSTVYTTTNINSLKSDLVVTAHYADTSTVRLADSEYTLSGTLAAGTSTITVVYGTKTTSFNVTVVGVTSIDAVYTQSGTIADTTPLTDLKSDLVVTATLDDSSTMTVPSNVYTLSGTLERGTSVVTVAAYGFTTTFNVTVTEIIDYTLNPLANISWMQGYAYNRSTGVISASANEWTSDKFTAQNCTYIFTNTDTTNNKYVLLLAWDENGNYIGFTHNGQGLYALKKNYRYAITLTNTTTFDQSTITIMPKDNTSTASNTFSIRLADFIGNITTYSTVYKIDVSSIMSAAGITSSNWNDKIASCNYLAALCMNPYPDPFLKRDIRFWFATVNQMRFDCDSVGGNNVEGLEAWISANDPIITFNY